MLAFLVYTRIVATLGTEQLAAHSLALRSLEVAILPGFALATAATALLKDLAFLQVVPEIANPLGFYPNRAWERAYRDLYQVDSEYTFLCAPNDTHNCLLRAYTKNGVIVRIEPSYGYGKAKDLDGNRASSRWDPRACQKGLALGRR